MAFYQLPSPVAIMCGVIAAFLLFKGSVTEKFETFVNGCGHSDIIIMCIIYLLAGAFAGVSKAMGGVESTANLGLTFIPPQYITLLQEFQKQWEELNQQLILGLHLYRLSI